MYQKVPIFLSAFISFWAQPSTAFISNATYPCSSIGNFSQNGLPCNISFTSLSSSTPTASVTETAFLTSPTAEYLRLLVIFFDSCSEYVKNEAQFVESFRSSVANLTDINRNHLIVNGISCTTGPKPYCGIKIDTIEKQARARRAIGGGRGRGGGSDKKKGPVIDSNFFKDYYNDQEPDCDGLMVNATLRPPVKVNKTLELMISLLYNRIFEIEVYDGQPLTAELILAAAKGTRFSRYKAPPPLFFGPRPRENAQPLQTDLKPLIFTVGSVLALVMLYVIYRLIKHSIFLRMNKFTRINSNKIHKKSNIHADKKKPEAVKITISPYDLTQSMLPIANSKAPSHTYNWSARNYSPNLLAPAYEPADRSGQLPGKPSIPNESQ